MEVISERRDSECEREKEKEGWKRERKREGKERRQEERKEGGEKKRTDIDEVSPITECSVDNAFKSAAVTKR